MTSRNKDTAIIIPVFNEASIVKNVIETVLVQFKTVICIDDGSSDESAYEIGKTSAYLVQHPINMGQGAALQTGIEFARQFENIKYFVTFDADGQHRLEDVDYMLKEIRKGGTDIILGSRFLGSTIGMTKSKKVMLKLAIKFSNVSSGLKLTDTHNGLRVFNRTVADTIQITMADMSHASEILEIIADKKYSYREVPVTIVYTDYSKAKGQSVFNAINIGFDSILRKIVK